MLKVFAVIVVFSQMGFSGAVKESLIEHEEAVYSYLQSRNIQMESISGSDYAKGKMGWLAISSDVKATDLSTGQLMALTCTSYFSINYEARTTKTEEVICFAK